MEKLKTLTPKILLCQDYNFARKMLVKLNLLGYDVVNFQIKTLTNLLQASIADRRMISNKEASLILYQLIQQHGYGFAKELMSEGAVLKLLEVLNDFRLLANPTYKGLRKAEYPKLVADYEQYLLDSQLIDYCLALKNYQVKEKQDVECYLLDDLILAPRELKIINETFTTVLPFKVIENEPKIAKIYNCYGLFNEVLNVLKIIEDHNINPADCTILVPNNDYENIITGLLMQNKISFSYQNKHLKASDVVNFMLDVIAYLANDYEFSLLENIINNSSLDQALIDEFYHTFAERIDKVGFGKERTALFNDHLKAINATKQAKGFASPYPFLTEFIDDLLALNQETYDLTALQVLAFKYVKTTIKEQEIITQTLQKINYYYKQSIDPNTLLKTELERMTMSEALSDCLNVERIAYSFTNKKHLFVLGMTQLNLTGSNLDNSFIDDLDEFKASQRDNPKCHLAERQKGEIIKKLDYYLHHSDATIYLSTYDFNKITLRPSSLSVYLLKLKNELKLEVEDVNLYPLHQKQRIAFKMFDIKPIEIVKEAKPIPSFSPSSAQVLASCVYHFYYQNLLGLPNVEYPTLSEVSWLDANAKGTFFHRIMELYAKDALMSDNFSATFDETIFIKAFDDALFEALKANVVKSEAVFKQDVKEIRKVAAEYLKTIIDRDFRGPYRTVQTEFNLSDLNYYVQDKDFKMKLSGIVDRVDGYLANGDLHLRIIDYKTGHYTEKKDNGYLQHLFYPYVIEKLENKLFNLQYDKIIIEEFIYDYPFAQKENRYSNHEIAEGYPLIDELIELVMCYYQGDQDIARKFKNKQDLIDENHADDKYYNPCKYCTYQNICYRKLVKLDLKEDSENESDEL